MFHWFLIRFNNLSVRLKLFLIVILGIFIPLFTANSFFIGNILREARESEQEYLRGSVESLLKNLENELSAILSVSRLIYADEGIYTGMNRIVGNMGEFYLLHHDYLNPTLQKYISVYDNILRITIYAENPALGTSSGYLKLNDYNRSTLWYDRLKKNSATSFLLYHLDYDKRQSYQQEYFLSLFRSMDNWALRKGTLSIIQRIDIKISYIQRHLDNLDFKGNVYLIDPWGNRALEALKGESGSHSYHFDQDLSLDNEFKGWRLTGDISMSDYNLNSAFKIRDFLIISAISVIISSLLIFGLSYSFSHRLQVLSLHMQKVENQDFSPISLISEGHDEIGRLIKDFNIMATRIDWLINEVYRNELEKEKLVSSRRKTQLNALQSQINPHFLNNVLESIRMKSLIKGERETADIVKKLGHLFRRITYWKDDMVTIADELDFVREYLEIQSYRFDEFLSWSVSCPKDLEGIPIPKITIQGLVENACIHGIERKGEPGRIDVAVKLDGDNIGISISDDGAGMDPGVKGEAKENGLNHSGIQNIRQRLKMHYGEGVRMTVESEAGRGTGVYILLPREEKTFE